MGRSVDVVVSELHMAAARLRDAGQLLQDGLAGVDLETRELLGSGWKGDAASAYGPAWDRWHNGAGQVIRGVQTMSDLLTLAGKEYAKTDQQACEVLDSTMQGTGGGASSLGDGPAPAGPGAAGGAATPHTSELAQQMDLDPASQLGQAAAQARDGAAGSDGPAARSR